MSSLRLHLQNIDMLLKQSTQPVWYIYIILLEWEKANHVLWIPPILDDI
jgi:hypothetical protein